MRAWPGKFDGLRLRLSAGWYSIPSYVSADERRLLVAMLVAGIAEIDHVVELDWDVLEEAADKLQLTRALAFVHVPANVEPDGEALQRVRASLGSVRLGLLQYEAAGVWADVAWQERQIKAPLLTWLKRWLRDSAHPFAKLGVADLPIDELAKLTAEPVELLIATEDVVAHRLRYRQQGMGTEDWLRSVMHVAAERLARRLMLIPTEPRWRALDLAMSKADESVVAALEDRDAGLALARVGLAWHGGNDLLLGPLVRLTSEPVVLRRLLELLPEDAWSESGKRRARRALKVFLPPPRAVLITPEPPYSSWPAIESDSVVQSWLSRDFEFDDGVFEWARHKLQNIMDSVEGRQLELEFTDWPQVPREWRDAFEASLAMLDEIEDEELLNLDFERGRIHRFDAVDRAWAQRSNGDEARAYFRWLGLTRLLRRDRSQRQLDVLAHELDRTHGLVDPATVLGDAIRSLKGDVLVRQSRYRAALRVWEEVDPSGHDERVSVRLVLRRSLALMRLDENAPLDELGEKIDPDGPFNYSLSLRGEDIDAIATIRELNSLNLRRSIRDTHGRIPGSSGLDFWHFPDEHPPPNITRIAGALELGDWPHAIHLLKSTERDTESSEGLRTELLRSWIDAALGDLDRANACFDELREQASEFGDMLAEAFAYRGLAAVAFLREQTDSSLASLAAAVDIERELGLPDADLLDLELVGWRVLAGQLTIADYNTKLAESEHVASMSFKFARLESYLRFLASSHAVVDAAEISDLTASLHPFIDTLAECLPLRGVSPWSARACGVAVELAARLADAGKTDEAIELRDAARRMAEAELPALIGE